MLYWAQRDLIRARELCPLAAETHFFIGRSANTFPQADEDLTYFERSLKLRPVDETLWFITGKTYLKRGDKSKAAAHFQHSLALSIRHLNEIMKLALTHMDAQMVTDELMPRDRSAPLIAAANWFDKRTMSPDANQSQMLQDLAQRLRQRALQTPELVAPNSGQLHHQKAQLLQILEQPKEAVSAFKLALNYEPQQYRWRLQLAKLLGEQKQYDEAHRQIKRILQYRPGNAAAKSLRDALFKQAAAER